MSTSEEKEIEIAVVETTEETPVTAAAASACDQQERCAFAKKTSIGGQAVIEGVMMRGPKKTALSVRMQDGTIDTETWENRKFAISKYPFIRGVFNFTVTMVQGYKTLMKSAEKAGFEEEPSEFEKKLEKIFGDKLYKIITVIAAVIAVGLAVVLFMLVPAWIASLTENFIPETFRTVIEGVIKIAVFILYVYLTSLLSDIKRVYQYHGAEHKTIACYEAGEELTPENVAKHKRFHPRCGTSFMLIVLIISILVFSLPFVPWDNLFLRVVIKLALLPVITSLAYEVIKLAGRHDNFFTRIISAPGMWLQRITTNEPDRSQIEVAIASMEEVIPKDDSDKW
ncbi:MAG: DUF1385 domain-containing protein [Ruminococcaceae bacterium]|nr:DUF1385 domain-containing protein [Oscillospiraceae bacterium]